MMRQLPFQETRQQGTLSFPCSMYFALAGEEPGEKALEVKPHWHDSIELLYLEKGFFQIGVNAEHFETDRKAFVLIESGMIHSIFSEKGYSQQAVLFTPHLLEQVYADAAGEEIIDPLVRGELKLPRMILEGNVSYERILQAFLRLRQVFRENGVTHADQRYLTDPAGQLKVKGALMEILAVLQEDGLVSRSSRKPDTRLESLKKTITWVREHYPEKVYVADLARIMNMNEQYFCRFFKRVMGRTPVAYLNEVRIRQAALLLERTDEQIVEIAGECGFGNIGHFINEFRRQTGCAPKEYRKYYQTGGLS